MKPDEFIKTIYFGDRCLKGIKILPWESRIEIQVDLISRVRNPTGNWEFYSAEDIPDGKLVINDVQSLQFSPSGPVPNDVIDSFSAEPLSNGRYEIILSVEAVQSDGHSTLVRITMNAASIHLESPEKPGTAITD